VTKRLTSLLVVCAVAVIIGALWFGQGTADPGTLTGDAYLGEIRMFGFHFCPLGWASADGQLLPISAYPALFSLYGTTYGGDGRTTFALPDFRGRVPIHVGQAPGLPRYEQGEEGALRQATPQTDTDSAERDRETGPSAVLVGEALVEEEPLDDEPRYLAVRFCVCLQGIFPPRP
jgi:microcystin-dependent protein